MIADGSLETLALLCRARGYVCALPPSHVSETMRPLPVEPFAGAPSFVRGVCVIRGAPTPVVDLGVLLGGGDATGACTRFVTVKAGPRQLGLAVESVIGLRQLPLGSLSELPPLLRVASADAVSAVAALDRDLLVVLNAARLVPESVWAVLGETERPR